MIGKQKHFYNNYGTNPLTELHLWALIYLKITFLNQFSYPLSQALGFMCHRAYKYFIFVLHWVSGQKVLELDAEFSLMSHNLIYNLQTCTYNGLMSVTMAACNRTIIGIPYYFTI